MMSVRVSILFHGFVFLWNGDGFEMTEELIADLAAYRQELICMMSTYEYLAVNRPEKRDWYNVRTEIMQRMLMEFDLIFYNKYLLVVEGDKARG